MKICVNGKWQELEEQADWPLAYALRNRLGLTGTKVGCELEQCHACVILADGQCTPSCVRTVADFENRQVVTVEGLLQTYPDITAEVLEAVCEEQAGQCGYCTPGIVVALVGQLVATPSANEAQLRAAIASHICRCGSYGALLRSISRLVSKKYQGENDGTASKSG
jgi:nicotinate dehydrogenase subunit A